MSEVPRETKELMEKANPEPTKKPMKVTTTKAGSWLSTELARKLVGSNAGEVEVVGFRELPSKKEDEKIVQLRLKLPPPPEALDREAAVGSG